jgi:hypothetical protein
MRFGRFGRLIGAAALLAALALPGTAAAQGGVPGGGGLPGAGGGGGGLPGGGGGGGGGGAALTLALPLAATPDFPAAIASISVSTSRVDASLDGTGLPLGSVVCILENVAPVACAQVSTPTGGVAFPHMPLSAFSLAPDTTYAMTRGTSNLVTIASVTLP